MVSPIVFTDDALPNVLPQTIVTDDAPTTVVSPIVVTNNAPPNVLPPIIVTNEAPQVIISPLDYNVTSAPPQPSPPLLPHKLVVDTSDDDLAGYICDDSEDEIEDMSLDEQFEKMADDEKKESNHIANYLDNYAEEEDIFSVAEVSSLKERKDK